MKKEIKISTNCFEISFFSNFNILIGILSGSVDFFSLREDITEITSMSIDVTKKELTFLP